MEGTWSDRVATSLPELAVDHVLLATSDLATGSRTLYDRYGLKSVEGGHHPSWGTANWIVPVADAYLELVAVVDERVAARSPFGRWVASARPLLVQPIGWAVRTTSLDAVAERHELSVNAGSRAAPSGQVLRWKLAGVEKAVAEPMLPFFVEWGLGTPHPSQALGADSNEAVEIACLELTGDADRLLLIALGTCAAIAACQRRRIFGVRRPERRNRTPINRHPRRLFVLACEDAERSVVSDVVSSQRPDRYQRGRRHMYAP